MTTRVVPVVQDGVDFVAQVGRAMTEVGFFALDGHGIRSDLLARALKFSCEVFDLSKDHKQKYLLPPGIGQPRGYSAVGPLGPNQQLVLNSPEYKEFWQMGPEQGERDPNFWPHEVPEFQFVFQSLFQEMGKIALRVLRACSTYMGEDPDFLSEGMDRDSSLLRVLNYPEVVRSESGPVTRLAVHRDLSLITVMSDPSGGGLEILGHDEQWHRVEPLEGKILINTGEILEYLSNGFFRCAYHRVVCAERVLTRRVSMPMFIIPEMNRNLSPSKKCIEKTSGQANYPDITIQQYLEKSILELPRY